MEEELEGPSEMNEELLSGFGNEKFRVISRIYGNRFGTVTLIVLNTETGDLKKHVFDNEKTEMNHQEQSEKAIKAETAANIQGEIIRLTYENPTNIFHNHWNIAIDKAADCCYGYEED